MKWLLIFLWCAFTNVQASTLKDPTKPNVSQSVSNANQDSKEIETIGLKLNAIINSKQNKQAIINGVSFSQGQEVQGYKVVLISQNHVLLDGLDGNKTLFVNNNYVKKDANNGF